MKKTVKTETFISQRNCFVYFDCWIQVKNSLKIMMYICDPENNRKQRRTQ